MPELTQNEINDLLRQHFARLLQRNAEFVYDVRSDPKVDPDREIEWMTHQIGVLQKRIAKQDFDPVVRSEAEDILAPAGHTLNEIETETRDGMLAGVIRANIEQYRNLIQRLQGIYEDAQDPLFKNVEYPASASQHSSPQAKETVEELIQAYVKLKCASGHWVEKTRAESERVLKWFAELVGPTRPLGVVRRDEVQDFRDRILRLPANYTKLAIYVTKSFKEVSGAPKEDGQHLPSPLSLKTASKYLDGLKTFLNWCVVEQHLEKSPATGIKIAGKSKAQDARLPFSAQQLSKIFSSPQFTGHKSDKRRGDPGKLIIRDANYWIPLIGLFSGMRLGEIAQLYVGDIKDLNGLLYFDLSLSEETPKELKSKSSARKIPVHPFLREAGFLTFLANRRKDNAKGRLFPEVQPGKSGYFSDKFSKTFGRYTIKIGAKSPKTSFHSFRHNFKDALVEAGIEDSHIKALLGHSDNSVTSTYGSAYGIPTLTSDLAKIDYKIDLSHLKIAKL